MSLRFTPQAVAEIDRIVAQIAARRPVSARKFAPAVRRTTEAIDAQPRSGAEYPSADPALGEIHYRLVSGFRSYVILYQVSGDEVIVLHVAHGRRDLDALLASDDPPP